MTVASTLIQKIETELSQVPGLGTQAYSDTRVLQLIQNTFALVCTERWWPRLMQWNQYTLDAVTGMATQAQKANSFFDIRAIFPPTYIAYRGRPLPQLPNDINPFMLLGTTPKYIEGMDPVANGGKCFRVWPLTATGTVAVHERVVPTSDFLPTDNVPFDDLAIIYGACWQYMVDDGANPSAAQKFQDLFNKRMDQLKKDYDSKPIDLDPRVFRTVDTWVELT